MGNSCRVLFAFSTEPIKNGFLCPFLTQLLEVYDEGQQML